MHELIKESFLAYAFVAAFTGLWDLNVVCGTFMSTKNVENKIIKNVLRFGISGVLVCLWSWFFIYMNLYPISLAYYEYNHDIFEEKIGVINCIERDGKDRIYIVIDDMEYTMVYSSVNPVVEIGKDISKGDTVTFKYGTKSKYIFDVQQMPEWQ